MDMEPEPERTNGREEDEVKVNQSVEKDSDMDNGTTASEESLSQLQQLHERIAKNLTEHAGANEQHGKISESQLALSQSLLAEVTPSPGSNEKRCDALLNFSKFAEESQDENVFQTWILFLKDEKRRQLLEESQNKEINELKQRLENLQREKTKLLEQLQSLQEKKLGMMRMKMEAGEGIEDAPDCKEEKTERE